MIPNLWQKVYDGVLTSQTGDLINLLSKEIIANGPNEFTPVVKADISNDLAITLKEINEFITANLANFEVKSIYLEMNGFDINYDRWYFDYFAYENYSSDPEDLEWLCDWHSENWPETTIVGMEDTQDVFKWYHENHIWKSNPELKETYETAMLLVMLKFMDFVAKVIQRKKLVRPMPVLCTAHGFESVYQIAP